MSQINNNEIEQHFFRKMIPNRKKIEEDCEKKYKDPGGGLWKEIRSEDGSISMCYSCQLLDGSFQIDLTLALDNVVTGRVIDMDTGEEYLPIRVKNHVGGFVASVREAYEEVLEEVAGRWFISLPFDARQANTLAGIALGLYGDTPQFLWEKYPDEGVFKHGNNGKWYAAILHVEKGKLAKPGVSSAKAEVAKSGAPGPKSGLASSNAVRNSDTGAEQTEIVAVANFKLPPERIDELVKRDGFYTAWHMNKKYWISVILDGTVSDEELMELLKESHALTRRGASSKKVDSHTWIIPSNPRVYNIEDDFELDGSIVWRQWNNVSVGDTVYIYVTAPYSAIMYRCEAVETDLVYDGIFRETSPVKKAMKLELKERYPRDKFTIAFMKANGGSVVRSARSVPPKLEAALRSARNAD